ncbi:MAG: C69 family dipeptidase [Bacteroidales bacterium]|jgi:dipeptidase|nr:C69 family dipeptidase [Bacteroidales bacterium]MDD3153114.1 C69 family dipeptidase [Bacteroidales bacterium]MDD3914884.1 C69 family dipeptidase [Bacteroidales bacterium]MDD4634669.1 C69 family dipeptidase [Bacteroidales bacterium]
MKIRKIFAFCILSVLAIFVQCQEVTELVGANCTSIMVGCKASADGSVITSHTCDSRYRTWVTMVPAKDYEEGAMHKVYKGTMHTETPASMENLILVGEIPEVAHTYAYMNTSYPCMNEKQLAIGETTFSGPDTLVNKKGMFLIEELERIALQRCDNARDAINVIGELIKEYGYGDGGECITIADKKEVWQLEIMGEGPDKIGGIWAAKRVPDDEVAVSCNIPRIGKLDRKNKDHFLCSDNIEEVAKKYGLWDGNGDLIWWKVFTSGYGNGKNHREREWYIFNELAPALNLSIEADELPFSVKPEEKVDVRKVMELFRANYDGSVLSQTQNLLYPKQHKDENGAVVCDTVVCPNANPWMSKSEREMYNCLKPGTVTFYRGVAMSWCSYSTVIQCRNWLPDAIGGLCWFAFENPGQSPRIPIYAGETQLPAGFNICGHYRYNDNAALWHYRKANKLAQIRWGDTKDIMLNNILRYEEKAFTELPAVEEQVAKLLKEGKVEEAQKLLNQYTADFAGATRQTWTEMEHRFWEMFWTGF